MINKILIANRGEIAVRIIETARRMGLETVAVYSEADADAVHTAMADEAVLIGPPEPGESYLRLDAILAAAAETSADAIHPGYGFLSERPEFAEACEANGITFIGPPASAMRQLGAKIDAKQLAVQHDVPIAPGYFEPGASAEDLKRAALEIGFPVLLKASAGGGGRGMRIVGEESELDQAITLASEEAVKAFGDGAMMVEKFIDRPRHIEVQVLADKHGQIACLFERECSLQRRHQKVLEEAPSPVMTQELWEKMRDAATRIVRASGYVGAGTVEFMVNSDDLNFYFLEVNARLQVEHRVTEAITGLDLVEQQIRIANGEKLGFSQALIDGDRSAITGHAIESRVIAEDPAHGFLPSVGKLVGWAEPRGPGVRFDTGFTAGKEISRFYDSLIAKLIVHGGDRAAATQAMAKALSETHILGVKTNIAYLFDLVESKAFADADFDTGYLERELGGWTPGDSLPEELANIVEMAAGGTPVGAQAAKTDQSPAWSQADRFRVTSG